MAVDVRLTREGEVTWGFEMLGGDEEAPLRVDKVHEGSPAQRAGLLTGDMILNINGAEAIDMTLAAATKAVAECGDNLKLGVMRGLYDPVLDDQEPIYETFEPADLDQPSEPTEVPFKIQQFIDAPEPLNFLETPEFNAPPPFSESRSLTASPFLTPTKPYRPFSTEPILEVPPIEDPIILNPDYKDNFGKSTENLFYPDELLSSYYKDVFDNIPQETKYKLPKSKQYDPEGNSGKIDINVNSSIEILENIITKSVKSDENFVEATKTCMTKNENKESLIKEENSQKTTIESQVMENVIEEQMIQEELKYIEKMKQEIDLDKIEETALSVVDESIERAVSVAEEIKKEMDEEFSITSERKESQSKILSEKDEFVKTKNENKIYEPTEESAEISETDIETKKHTENLERLAAQYETHKEINQQEQYDISESIKRNSVAYNNEFSTQDNNFVDEHNVLETSQSKSTNQEGVKSIRVESKEELNNVSKTVHDKSSAEQRIYSIGLQTIPNIRGVAHSSYHYDLLLKTFFIHLTDVMVALSRFILTQPVFNTQNVDSKSHETMTKTTQTIYGRGVTNQTTNENKMEEVKPVIQERKESQSKKTESDILIQSTQERKLEQVIKPLVDKESTRQKVDKNVQEIKTLETRKGSKMAQLSENKFSQELTQKMDAVVAEFQTKATTDCSDILEVNKEILQRNRRSRSRSQVEEEVMNESDPLEWLAKVDSRRASQEHLTEESKKEFSSSLSESIEKKKCETTYDIKQNKKSKPPKQTYVAIVEAHVYTNKDVIFEEQISELSETSSVQSAEELNTAFEAIEAETTESVTIENAVKELETAKVLVEESHEFERGNIQSEATIQKVEEAVYDTKEIVYDNKTKDKAVVRNNNQEIIVQETQEIIKPVVQIEEKKHDVEIHLNESILVTESQQNDISEPKQEFTSIQEHREEAMTLVEKETNEFVAKEELITDNFTEIVKVQEVTENCQESMKTEYKIIEGEEVSETVMVKEKPEKKYAVEDEFAELKIVKQIDLDLESTNEIIEIEEINENCLNLESEADTQSFTNKLEILKEIEVNQCQQITEKSIVSSQCGSEKTVSNELVVAKQEFGEQKCDVTKQAVLAKDTVSKHEVEQSSNQFAATSLGTGSQNARYDFESKSVVAKAEIPNEIEHSLNIEQTNYKQSSFIGKSSDKNLTLRTDLQAKRQTSVQSDENNNIDTPTPSTVPPTPLVDEYIFKLTIPLPKSRSATPVPRDCTPPNDDDHEDPDIVKRKLIPHIETTIEQVLFDPPLPTPPSSKVSSPVYTKPGLRGGADRPEYFFFNRKEEIREIERKSSLLASAIDETIKSIEEYKEEVGIETKKVHFQEENATKTHDYSTKTTMQNRSTEAFTNSIHNINESSDNKDKTIEIPGVFKDDASTLGFNLNEDSKSLIDKQSNGQIEVSKVEAEVNIMEINDKNAVETTSLKEKRSEIDSNLNKNISDNRIQQQAINVEVSSVASEVKNVDIKDETVLIQVSQPKEDRRETSNIKIVNSNESVTIAEPVDVKIETKVIESQPTKEEEKPEGLPGFRPVAFDPEAIPKHTTQHVMVELKVKKPSLDGRQSPYVTETGEPIGTIQGIVDGLEEPVLDPEVAKELGKPGMSEDKIAELISGEAEMLREAHVMGLARVLNSHMHRVDDSSVDFEKIKPMINSLKDSEVLKALNEELAKEKAEKKKMEEKRWTTFLQKPKGALPKPRYGYHGWVQQEEEVGEPYKVKIVKQPKPKVAPDYKPEEFETGPLPWEERQEVEASLPPIEPEEPILVPEVPEFFEAVDPLPESEVPDLEDTGIPLPPIQPKDPTPPPIITEDLVSEEPEEKEEKQEREEDKREEERQEEIKEGDMENGLAEQLVRSVKSMVDPNATLEQQLCQMRAQLAALAQLPEVIQQTLELVSRQLVQIAHQEARVEESQVKSEAHEEVNENHSSYQESEEQKTEASEYQEMTNGVQENGHEEAAAETAEDNRETQQLQAQQNGVQKMSAEVIKSEKQLKAQANQRQIRQRSAPRQCRPQPKFGPLDPDQRPVILPGGRRWRNIEDVYNEQLIAETLHAQAELIQGKALGFESDLLPFDSSINFKKYEKPPVSLDHLQRSEVYKAVHNMDQTPLKQVEQRKPALSEAEYRERCRSMTPTPKQHFPQQFHP